MTILRTLTSLGLPMVLGIQSTIYESELRCLLNGREVVGVHVSAFLIHPIYIDLESSKVVFLQNIVLLKTFNLIY